MAQLDDASGLYLFVPGAVRSRNYLERDVIPWATRRYPTDRKILGATSLWGLFVLDTFLERPMLLGD